MKKKSFSILLLIFAAAILAGGVLFYLHSRPTGDQLPASIHITPLSQEETGVLPESAFEITSGYRVSQQQLRQMLQISPLVEYELTGAGKTWTLTPAQPLAENTVYTFQLMGQEEKAVQSFAFQTKSDLLVSDCYPYGGASYVDPDSGIEITFNAAGVELGEYFEILPPVDGEFQTAEYTCIFQPAQALEENTAYRVRVKAGLKAPNGMELKEDYIFSFTTQSRSSGKEEYQRLRLNGPFSESFLTGDPLAVELRCGYEDILDANFHITLHQFPSVKEYEQELRSYTEYANNRYGEIKDYLVETENLPAAAEFDARLLGQGDDYWSSLYAVLPENMAQGYYVATISGDAGNGREQFVQKLIQIQNLSVYTQSANGETLLWINDPLTGQPVPDAKIRLESLDGKASLQGQSLGDGTVRLISGEMEEGYLSIQLPGESAAGWVDKVQLSSARKQPLTEKYYTAVYTDREIYQPDDTIAFWGVVKPRKDIFPLPSSITALIGSSENPAYKVRVPVEKDGTFQGELKISGLRSSWYSLELTDGSFPQKDKDGWYDAGSNTYYSKGMNIQNYTKPSYVISVDHEKPYYYANDPIDFHISADYFDGTPAAGIRVEINGGWTLAGEEKAPLTEEQAQTDPSEKQNPGTDEPADGQTQQQAQEEPAQEEPLQEPAVPSVTLDGQGKGVLTLRRGNDRREDGWDPMDPENLRYAPSWAPSREYASLGNGDPEDVYFYKSIQVPVLYSKVAMKLESEDPSQLTVYTNELDTSKLPKDFYALEEGKTIYDTVSGAPVDVPVTVIVSKVQYQQIEIGSYYDPVNKKTIKRYRAQRVETIADVIQRTTQNGILELKNLPYENTADTYYWIAAATDGKAGEMVRESLYYTGRYDYRNTALHSYSFVPVTNHGDYGYSEERNPLPKKAGEKFTLGLYDNGVPVPNQGKVLYSLLQKNILETGFYTGPEQELTFDEEYIPNVTIAGAYFDGRHVYRLPKIDRQFDFSTKELVLKVQLDKESYQPGETAKVTVTASDLQGNPVAAQACIGVVDEAVFALAPQELDLANQLYKGVFYPEIVQNVSYTQYNLQAAQPETVGMGGGGDGGELRKDFADTAYFAPVSIDESGISTIELVLKDQITSWRITAAAVTQDLRAGSTTASVPATLPFSVRVLYTENYLAGDDIVFSAQPVLAQPKTGGQVEYTAKLLDMNGNEIEQITRQGEISSPAAFSFGKRQPGQYRLSVEAALGDARDGMECAFSVLEQGLSAPVIKNIPLEEISQVQTLNYPVAIQVYDQRLTPYMKGIQKLSSQQGERTEVTAAAYQAQVLYNRLLEEEDQKIVSKDYRLNNIQTDEGGVRILGASDGAAAITAKMLAAAPQLIDSAGARSYLMQMQRDPAATPEDRVMTYMGLAAVREPVLLDINRLLAKDGLSDAQKLYLGAGLAMLGDFTGANNIYTQVAQVSLKTEGQLKYMSLGSGEEMLETTGAALMLTSLISHEDADGLMLYLCEQGEGRSQHAFDGLVNLEMLAYLENFTPPKGEMKAKFSYVREGKTQEVTLGELGVKPIALSGEEFENANFQALSGEVMACIHYVDYVPQTLAGQDALRITKTLTPVGGDNYQVAKKVRVDLTLHFGEDAPSGCYVIQDLVPAGMRYLPVPAGGGQPWFENCWGYLENDAQQISGYVFLDRDTEFEIDERVQRWLDSGMSLEEAKENAGYTDVSEYTLSYYMNCVLPGEFVLEGAYGTPYVNGIAAKSEGGTVTILPSL